MINIRENKIKELYLNSNTNWEEKNRKYNNQKFNTVDIEIIKNTNIEKDSTKDNKKPKNNEKFIQNEDITTEIKTNQKNENDPGDTQSDENDLKIIQKDENDLKTIQNGENNSKNQNYKKSTKNGKRAIISNESKMENVAKKSRQESEEIKPNRVNIDENDNQIKYEKTDNKNEKSDQGAKLTKSRGKKIKKNKNYNKIKEEIKFIRRKKLLKENEDKIVEQKTKLAPKIIINRIPKEEMERVLARTDSSKKNFKDEKRRKAIILIKNKQTIKIDEKLENEKFYENTNKIFQKENKEENYFKKAKRRKKQ